MSIFRPPNKKELDQLGDDCKDDLIFDDGIVYAQCDSNKPLELIIHDFSVRKEYWRRGHGRRFLIEAIKEYPLITANGVAWESEKAGRFWKQMAVEGLVASVITYEFGEIYFNK